MTETLNVLTICGSIRKASYNAALLRALPQLAPESFKISEAPSWEDIPIYNFDIQSDGFPKSVTDWADAIRRADGVIVASPEYNWSVPGGLKNAIDWTSRMKDDPFKGKPVALQSCAGGLLGGARMQNHLWQIFSSIGADVLLKPQVIVTFAPSKFDKDTLALSDQGVRDAIKLQLNSFERFIKSRQR